MRDQLVRSVGVILIVWGYRGHLFWACYERTTQNFVGFNDNLTYETAELGAEGSKICRRAGLGGLLGVERFAWLPYGCLALVVVASWLPVIRGTFWFPVWGPSLWAPKLGYK
jgi:hypothetical protein